MTRSGVRSPSAPPVSPRCEVFRNSHENPRLLNALATHRCYTRGMSEMGKPTGLVKRGGSSVWYFRQRCPHHLKAPGKPLEVWISLGTSSYQDALKRLDEARAEATRRFAARPTQQAIFSRSALPSSPISGDWPLLKSDQAASLARALFADAIRELDASRPDGSDVDHDQRLAWKQELETMHARLSGAEPEDGIDDVAGAMFSVLQKARLRSDDESEAGLLLRNYLRRAMALVCKIKLSRLDGDYEDRITDSLFSPRQPVPANRNSLPANIVETTIGQAVKKYQATLFADPTTDKTKDRYRAELKHIVSFFGEETPVWSLNADECDRFRDTFAQLPPNFEDKLRGGQTILEIVEQRRPDDRRLSWATLDKYLSQLSRFLRWAHKRDYIAKNYADGLKPLDVKPDGSMSKLPFEDEELRRVFARPMYTGCRDDRYGFAKPGPNIVRRARYWAPLIGLFAGLRCGEILQLTTEHFRVSPEGNDFIVLTPDMQLKSENAEREIPVHPTLIAIGLVDWVARKRKRGELALFPEVPAHSRFNDRSTRFSKWFESDLRHFDLGDRRAKLTFHSFRHTFKRGLDRADIPEDKKEEICGWARGKKVGRRYGVGLEADVLRPCVDAVRYDLDLSHLYEHAKLRD